MHHTKCSSINPVLAQLTGAQAKAKGCDGEMRCVDDECDCNGEKMRIAKDTVRGGIPRDLQALKKPDAKEIRQKRGAAPPARRPSSGDRHQKSTVAPSRTGPSPTPASRLYHQALDAMHQDRFVAALGLVRRSLAVLESPNPQAQYLEARILLALGQLQEAQV